MHIVRKILIIRFSSIGDIVLTSPLLRALRTTFPDARIDFLTKTPFVDLVRFNPHISSVIGFDADGPSGNTHGLAERIRQERYNVILDLHNNLRSAYVRWFSGARLIRVINKRIVPRFFLVHSAA